MPVMAAGSAGNPSIILFSFTVTAQMPVMAAGPAGYPIHGGVLPGGSHHQTLNYAAQPSLLMPQHPVPAPALAYNPHLYMTQHQSHVPLPHAPQYLH
ncbi:hypothetical protein LSTR_LSTR003428 [Laodelphax striatellus]|uniref:Uncharacterized protein n=1 Tax=Laodelphax striatellus TaxID=195883 RepID=A0A482X1L5_LAOST|nr:hypothetical protein LSTR_LSTR003428 [Laodelphax striatellus]